MKPLASVPLPRAPAGASSGPSSGLTTLHARKNALRATHIRHPPKYVPSIDFRNYDAEGKRGSFCQATCFQIGKIEHFFGPKKRFQLSQNNCHAIMKNKSLAYAFKKGAWSPCSGSRGTSAVKKDCGTCSSKALVTDFGGLVLGWIEAAFCKY